MSSASSRIQLRKLWFQVHLWLGIALSAVLVPICVTGAYEVWQDEIDRAFHPSRYAVSEGPALGLEAYAAAAQRAFGDQARVSVVRPPEKPGDPALVTGVMGAGEGRGADSAAGARAAAAPQAGPQRRPTLTAWIDPSTARVLGVANPAKSFKQTMHRLHGSLLIPGVGRKVVGWLGWALFVSALTGIWLWWPRGALRKGFRFRRTGSTLLNLHYFTGLWIAIPLAVLAATGAFISFPQFTRSVLSPIAPVSAQQRPGGPGGPGGSGAPVRDAALTIEQVAQLARQAAPGAELVAVTLPTRSSEGPVWRVQLARGEAAPINVTVADATGAAEVQRARPVLAGDAVLRWNRRIHDGEGAGVIWKVIITVAGLVPALLAVTGVIVWARRQLRKARLRAPDPVAEPVPAE